MMEIKVAGPGCPKCNQLENLVKEVVSELGMDAQVSKITDFSEIVQTGIMTTPGLIVNGKVKVSGKLPTKEEITQILTTEAAQ
ncbi:thioredoxin family protein [Desulfonatronospira sp.]|uniref:thioredoxin family protein n=1 Tax=Desulfonatronospira sp. TaxID=1962951 RepID=UPI0025BAA9BB|nr:thioredoxin family protein [Desulfonatronospira sp.]